jgi:ABC-type transport system involved in multi-copper enzyme maturation permease subunit
MRIGPGPVFVFELIAGARRWQMFTQRSALILLLLGVLTSVFVTEVPLGSSKQLSLAGYSALGQKLGEAVFTTQLALIILVVPAAMAMAVCSDNARSKLELMLVTDLSSTEIVMGTLCSQLIPILGMIAASLPVLLITGMMGGINWAFLLRGYIVLIGASLVFATLGLATAVSAKKPGIAIWKTYFDLYFLYAMAPLLLVAFLRPTAIFEWLNQLNPFALICGPTPPDWGIALTDYGPYMVVAGCASTLLVALTIWKLRRVVQVQRNPAKLTWQPGVRAVFLSQRLLDSNPLRWYERHRRLSSPTELSTLGGLAILLCGTTVAGIALIDNGMAFYFASLLVLMGLLWVTIDAAMALAGERTRGNLEVLLATPFSSRSILHSKWRASIAWIPIIFVWPVLLLAVDRIVFMINDTRASSFELVPMLLPYLSSAAVFYVCLGLFLAAWLRESGRAVSAAVTFMVVVLITLPYLINAVAGSNDHTCYLIFVSPPVALIDMVSVASTTTMPHGITAMLVWTLLHAVGAMVLYRLTLRIFDQSLGRITKRTGCQVPLKNRARSTSQ